MGYKIRAGFAGMRLLVLMLCLPATGIAQDMPDVNSAHPEYPIPWKPIKEADILWRKRVWREIEVYERANSALKSGEADAFASVLLNGIKAGAIKAYADGDTSFVHPLALQGIDTLAQCDAAGLSAYARTYLNRFSRHQGDATIRDTTAITSCVFPQQVEFYEIREDWIFDRDKGQMVVHIDAIAPAAFIHGMKKPLFWLHYPDIRSFISKYGVFDDGKKTGLNWDEYFESRVFSSRITNLPATTEQAEGKTGKHRKKRKTDDSLSHDVWIY